jgi:tetratricopeptide (TPR) repeat protein
MAYRVSTSTRTATVFLIIALVLAGCARTPEAKKARHLERGDRYFKQEQYREAILEYRNALRIDQKNATAIRQLGLAHYQLGQVGVAFRYLLQAEQLEPDNTDIRLKLANIYMFGGRPDDASALVDEVLKKEPNNLDALVLSAAGANTPNEIDAAIRRLQAAPPQLGATAKLHLALAGLHLRRQDPASAERELREAVAREPKSVEAHAALGNLHVSRKEMADAEREFKTAAELAPLGSPARVRLADFYILIRRPDEARRTLKETVAKAPDSLPAWRLLARLDFAEGKLDETVKALDVLLKKSPADVDGHLLRGRVHLAKNETTAAMQEFQNVLKSEPRMAGARFQMALAHLQTGNVLQAKNELKEVTASAPEMIEAAMLLAELNLNSGALQPAVEDLERVIRIQPKAAGAYMLLGRAYLAQRQPAKVADTGRRLIAAVPKDPRGPFLLGLGLSAQGKRPEARREFEAALAASPGFLDPLVQLIQISFNDKQPDAALAIAQKQAALVSTSAPHQVLLASVHLTRREPQLAEAAYLKAIELEPKQPEPYRLLAALYAETKRYDQALTRLDQLLKNNPGDSSALMLRGVIHEEKGDIAKAQEAYEMVLAINPRFAAAANNLAWIYSEHGGDRDKALQLAQTAKEVAPDDPRISDTLGWILYKRGVPQRALALLKESAAKLPDNPQVQYHLGMASAQAGDQPGARKALTAAVNSPAAFPGKDEAKKALAALK